MRSMMCRFHVQTAGSSLTAQSIDNNVVRTTVQALAAVLGGAQSLHTNARDEALALPTAEAARLALRTQQILAYESGVTETPDPLAGSYYVETLTDEVEAAAWELLAEIDASRRHARGDRGRLPAAPDPGVGLSRAARDRDRGDRSSSGLNQFVDDEPAGGAVGSSSGSTRRASAARSRASARVRAERDPEAWRRRSMDRLEDAARGGENVLPPLIEAVKADATLGEISDRLRAAWGEHREAADDLMDDSDGRPSAARASGSGPIHHVGSSSPTSRRRSASTATRSACPSTRSDDLAPDGVRARVPRAGTGARLELVQPTRGDTGVARFLASRGPGMHHVCFEVPDLAATLTALPRRASS